MSKEAMGTCWSCRASLTRLDYGRGETCPGCHRSTKVCKNCEFYDPAFNNSCRETQADRVVDKESANFCDYFLPSARAGGSTDPKAAARAAAEALFKKK